MMVPQSHFDFVEDRWDETERVKPPEIGEEYFNPLASNTKQVSSETMECFRIAKKSLKLRSILT